MSDDYKVCIRGFKSKEQAAAFVSWYEGQGEQHVADWADYMENLSGLDWTVDLKKGIRWKDSTLYMNLKL